MTDLTTFQVLPTTVTCRFDDRVRNSSVMMCVLETPPIDSTTEAALAYIDGNLPATWKYCSLFWAAQHYQSLLEPNGIEWNGIEWNGA